MVLRNRSKAAFTLRGGPASSLSRGGGRSNNMSSMEVARESITYKCSHQSSCEGSQMWFKGLPGVWWLILGPKLGYQRVVQWCSHPFPTGKGPENRGETVGIKISKQKSSKKRREGP